MGKERGRRELMRGTQAEVFSLETYDHASIKDVFARVRKTWPDGRLKTAVWNTGQWVRPSRFSTHRVAR